MIGQAARSKHNSNRTNSHQDAVLPSWTPGKMKQYLINYEEEWWI